MKKGEGSSIILMFNILQLYISVYFYKQSKEQGIFTSTLLDVEFILFKRGVFSVPSLITAYPQLQSFS